jgi:exopolyphosphatase / guanosine-5'-triphosphate,3'-diphosphate pyrophosphatase
VVSGVVRAAIDVGSNSLLLTVMEDDRVLHDEARIVGLGKGLGGGGPMEPARREHGFEVFRDYVRRASELGVRAEDIRAAATSGARRATDAAAFFAEVHAELGLVVATISGEEEARLSWAGALTGLTLDWPVLLVDLGGGSTELVLGDSARTIRHRSSREYGAVRMHETHGTDLAAIARQVDTDLAKHHLRATSVVAVAGTATMFGALEQDLQAWDGAAIHGFRVSRERLQYWSQRLSAASSDEQARLAHLAPPRGPYLAGGAVVLDRVLAAAGVTELTLSNGGLRFGLLAD